MSTENATRIKSTDSAVDKSSVGSYSPTSSFSFRSDHSIVERLFGEERSQGLVAETPSASITFLPWTGRKDTVAAFRKPRSTGVPVPVEYYARDARQLAKSFLTRRAPLFVTPAGEIDQGGDVDVTWHARVRWNERINESTEPAPTIRRLFKRSIHVSAKRRVRYYPPKDLSFIYDSLDKPFVRTVYHPDEKDQYNFDHLHVCRGCQHLFDRSAMHRRECFESGVCPWCGDDTADAISAQTAEGREVCVDVE